MSTENTTDTVKQKQRVELHLHTKMSAMDGLTDAWEAAKRAAQWGHSAIAVTDLGSVQAFPDAQLAARRYGVKVIYGLESRYINDADGDFQRQNIILLAQNTTGLKNLYKILSEVYLNCVDGEPTAAKSLIIRHRDGLLVGADGEGGEILCAIEQGADDEKLRRLAEFYDYMEVQPFCEHSRLAHIAAETGKLLVAVGNVRFLDREDECAWKILLRERGDDESKSKPLYLKTTKEMLAEFADLGEALCRKAVIENPRKIAEMCENIEPFPEDELLLPTLDGFGEKLTQLCRKRLVDLYGENPPESIETRLETELGMIRKSRCDVMFAAYQRLAEYSRKNGYPVGSRGSVAASLAAYLCGITDINPLPPHYRCPECGHTDFSNMYKADCGVDMPESVCPYCGARLIRDGFDIPFETFFGYPGEEKTPDISLNFADEFIDKAGDYLRSLFGAENVFEAGAVKTVSDEEAEEWVGKHLDSCVNMTDEEMQRIISCCEGVKRGDGSLRGRFIIAPQGTDITDFSPVQPSGGAVSTHFEYYHLAKNFIKIDMLGQNTLTLLRRLEKLTGVALDTIPLDDTETMSIFRSGEVCDIPMAGFVDSLEILAAVRPETFADLVRVYGFCHGTGVWEDNAELLIRSGTAKLREVVSLRDDIFRYLIGMGMERKSAYRLMERSRKGMLKIGRVKPGWENELRALNIPEWYIESLKKVAYIFPKAHAVDYVTRAFRAAWYKTHYPAEYESAVRKLM